MYVLTAELQCALLQNLFNHLLFLSTAGERQAALSLLTTRPRLVMQHRLGLIVAQQWKAFNPAEAHSPTA